MNAMINKKMNVAMTGLAMVGLVGCGELIEDDEQFQVDEEVSAVTFAVDSGNIELFASETPVEITRYLDVREATLGEVDFSVTAGVLSFMAECDGPGRCVIDHHVGIDSDTDVTINLSAGNIDLYELAGDIDGHLSTGNIDGERLSMTHTEFIVDSGNVRLTYEDAPEEVRVAVSTGKIRLVVPAGDYECDLDTDVGDLNIEGVTCDGSAANLLHARVSVGDITVVAQ